MAEILSKLFDIGKLPSKVVALVFLVSTTILFSPSALHEKLHTKELLDRYGLFVGLAFIASGALLGLNVFIWVYGHFGRKLRRARWQRDLAKAITRLDHTEISVLREFFIQGKQTLMLPVDEPTVAGLLRKGLVHSASTVGQQSIAGILFPVAIDSDFQDVLSPAHVGLPPSDPSPADIERVRAERPSFMKEVARIEERRSHSGW